MRPRVVLKCAPVTAIALGAAPSSSADPYRLGLVILATDGSVWVWKRA